MNDEFRNRAALEHIETARKLASRHKSTIGEITDEHVAVLLGRLIRGVDELNVRLDRFESRLKGRPPPDE